MRWPGLAEIARPRRKEGTRTKNYTFFLHTLYSLLSTVTIGTLTNYGTFQFQHPVFAAGTKLYNYGTLKTGSLSLPSNSEIHNFGSINSTFLEIALGSTTYSHPASRIDADNLEIRGHIVGDAYNYSSLTSTNTTLHTSGSVMGLVKLCTRQQLHANGEIGSMVVQDCSFTIPVLQQRTAHLYRSQQGYKAYELSNHLGNVLTTISDRRIGVAGSNPALIDHYTAVILSSQDYYAFGSTMPGRKYNSTNYRYGFNGKELDPEGMGGGGSTYDYGFRIYNPNIGKFLSLDPLFRGYPWNSTYAFAENTPIACDDVDGKEKSIKIVQENSQTCALTVTFLGPPEKLIDRDKEVVESIVSGSPRDGNLVIQQSSDVYTVQKNEWYGTYQMYYVQYSYTYEYTDANNDIVTEEGEVQIEIDKIQKASSLIDIGLSFLGKGTSKIYSHFFRKSSEKIVKTVLSKQINKATEALANNLKKIQESASKKINQQGVTRRFQALSKKIGRKDPAYKDLKLSDEQAEKIVNEVITNPNKIITPNRNQQGNEVIDIFDPNTNRGVRLTKTGEFDTFINKDPRIKK